MPSAGLVFVGAKTGTLGCARTRPSRSKCAREDLPDVLAALAALTAGVKLIAARAGTVPMDRLRELAGTMHRARYGAIVWGRGGPGLRARGARCPGHRPHFDGIEPDHALFHGVPLGGNEADLTADAVLLWQSGYRFAPAFATGRPEYDPYLFDAQRLLAQHETDALLWLSALSDLPVPPTSRAPLILLAGPNAGAARRADVYFPVATPGIDHGGHLVRTDKVLTMHAVGHTPPAAGRRLPRCCARFPRRSGHADAPGRRSW